MPTIELQVTNPSGIHARPATHFVKIASGFASRITLENLDRASRPVDAKSLLMLLTAGVVAGHRVVKIHRGFRDEIEHPKIATLDFRQPRADRSRFLQWFESYLNREK